MKLKHAVVFATALSLAPFTAFAGKKAAPPAPKPFIPTLSQVFNASGINVAGVVDMSYDLSRNDATGSPAGSATFRQFDTHPNSFVFHQLNLTISKQWSNGLSLVVNPIFGEDANSLNAATTRSAAAFGTGAPATSNFALTQAYLAYTNGGWTIMGGKFVTLASAEVINPAGNINASRSFLFTNLAPLTHVGVRNIFALCRNLTLTVGAVNSGATPNPNAAIAGVGNADTDNNSDISLESQLAFTSGLFSTSFTYITGDEGGSGTLGGDNRSIDLYDFVASFTPVDAVTLGLNADYRVTDALGPNAAGDRTYDSGIAGYVNFKLTPRARIALRGEYVSFDDNSAATGYAYYKEVTATFGYSPLSGLELIAEARHDDVNDTFAPFPAISRGGFASFYQDTATLKAIYKF